MTTQHSGRAISDYVARNEKEITIKNGQAIEIESIRGQWWLVRTSNGKTGYVPSHCVESYETGDVLVSAPSRYPNAYSVRESVRDHTDGERQDNPRQILISRRVIRDDTIGYDRDRDIRSEYGTELGTTLGHGLATTGLGTNYYGRGSGFPTVANSTASGMFQSGFNTQMPSGIQGQQWTYASPEQGNPFLQSQSLRMPPYSGFSGFGTPIPGAPGFGTPPSGVPGFDSANYNTLTYGGPGYGAKTLGTPGFGGPTLGTPSFGGSTFSPPGFGGSTFSRPGFGGSTFSPPGFGGSTFSPPGFGGPSTPSIGYGAQTIGQTGFNFGAKR